MKQYSFNTFLTDEGNREAAEICQKVADLQPADPQPITIVGDEGSGKTHLLYAIVNRVRASSARVGLAYVTAYDFPDQVRALIDDPSPLQRAPQAILLVDQLEDFGQLVEELEAVVRIFLDSRHYVLFGSNIHPGRLQNIGPGLRSLIERGRIVSIRPHDQQTQSELSRRKGQSEQEAELAKQRQEIHQLRQLLETVSSQQGMGVPTDSQLAAQLEAERAEKDELARKFDIANEYNQSIQRELAALQSKVAQLGGEEPRTVVGGGAPDAQVAALQSEKESLAHEAQRLREELEAARAGSDIAREEANQLLQRAARLLEHIDSGTGEAPASVEELEAMLQEREAAQLAGQSANEELVEKLNAALEERDEFATLLESANEERDALKTSADEAQAELVALRETSSSAEAELETLRSRVTELQSERDELSVAANEARGELEDLHQKQSALQADLMALRKEAAAQVAEAQTHAGELEGRLLRLQAAANRSEEDIEAVRTELADLQDQFETAALAMGRLARRLFDTRFRTAGPVPMAASEFPVETAGFDSETEMPPTPAAPPDLELGLSVPPTTDEVAAAAPDIEEPSEVVMPAAYEEDIDVVPPAQDAVDAEFTEETIPSEDAGIPEETYESPSAESFEAAMADEAGLTEQEPAEPIGAEAETEGFEEEYAADAFASEALETEDPGDQEEPAAPDEDLPESVVTEVSAGEMVEEPDATAEAPSYEPPAEAPDLAYSEEGYAVADDAPSGEAIGESEEAEDVEESIGDEDEAVIVGDDAVSMEDLEDIVGMYATAGDDETVDEDAAIGAPDEEEGGQTLSDEQIAELAASLGIFDDEEDSNPTDEENAEEGTTPEAASLEDIERSNSSLQPLEDLHPLEEEDGDAKGE